MTGAASQRSILGIEYAQAVGSCHTELPFAREKILISTTHKCRQWVLGERPAETSCQGLCNLTNCLALHPEISDRLLCMGWVHTLSPFRVPVQVRDSGVSME